MKEQHSEVIIIGAGLSGLATAYFLEKQGISSIIIEARDRIGGRIHTNYQEGQAPVEMGATWLGKKHKKLVALLEELNLGIFEQQLGNHAVYEPISTSPPQLVTLPPESDPSFRIKGGSSQLIFTLKDKLKSTQILTEHAVSSIKLQDQLFQIDTSKATFTASIVVSTLPPRLLIQSVAISPSLPQSLTQIANETHTWMGESIKVALTYATPFWREQNRSGTIFSNVGPISEMYDHANIEDNYYALKGFMNGAYHIASKEQRLQAIMNQLGRYFGEEIKDFTSYEETVWRKEPFTFIDYDAPLLPHNHNGDPVFRQGFLNGKLFVAGSETAGEFPGYMDGAVRSAEFICHEILRVLELG